MEKDGTIVDVQNSKLRDDASAEVLEFINPAHIPIEIDNKVVYLYIVAGNGKPIIILKNKKS